MSSTNESLIAGMRIKVTRREERRRTEKSLLFSFSLEPSTERVDQTYALIV